MTPADFETYKATLSPDDAFMLEERAAIIQAEGRTAEEANGMAVKLSLANRVNNLQD